MTVLARHLPALVADHDSFLLWALHGTRLITIHSGTPILRTQLAAAIIIQAIVLRYDVRSAERLFGYVNAPAVFDELYTQRFGDVSALKSLLYDPGILALVNVQNIPDVSMPLFIRCVQERCDASRVTIITTSKDGYTMLYAHEDMHERMLQGRTVTL